MLFFILVCCFATIVTLIIGLSLRPEAPWMRRRVEGIARPRFHDRDQTFSIVEQELQKPLFDRMARPFLRMISAWVMRLTPAGASEATSARLNAAGNPWRVGVREFFGLRVMSASLLTLLGIGTMHALTVAGEPMLGAVSLVLLMLIGVILPDYVLQIIINGRQYQIRKSLPDILDLLIVSVEAGLGFDGAMQKVVQKVRGPFPEELGRILEEMRLGKGRMAAMQDMARRVSVNEVSTFVAAIYQADQLGVSIARVLNVQADTMRLARSQRIRELAAKLPVKMLFPLVFFIFPAIFVVVIGPGVIEIMKAFVFNQ
jgi:tight adherence protein C